MSRFNLCSPDGSTTVYVSINARLELKCETFSDDYSFAIKQMYFLCTYSFKLKQVR